MNQQDDWGFAPPPFRPDEALVRLKRDLRELGLSERSGVFERRGTAIARVQLSGERLNAEQVKQPSRRSPVWESRTLRTTADVRDFVAGLKKKLVVWSDVDD